MQWQKFKGKEGIHSQMYAIQQQIQTWKPTSNPLQLHQNYKQHLSIFSIKLIKLIPMKCSAPRNLQQRTAQHLYITNSTLRDKVPENQGRNLAITEEGAFTRMPCPGSSEQGLLNSTQPTNKCKPQKMIYLNSINHNFQKHTVATVKKLTKNIDSAFGYGPIGMLAHRMWNVFLTSGLKSKQILVILFGAANMADQRYKELLKRCYFGQLCSYGQENIRSAQDLLRQRVASLLSEERVRRNIQECRLIKNRAAFYHYFLEFVQTLKKGPLLNFRINRQISHRISQRMKAFPPIIRNQTQKRAKNRIRKTK